MCFPSARMPAHSVAATDYTAMQGVCVSGGRKRAKRDWQKTSMSISNMHDFEALEHPPLSMLLEDPVGKSRYIAERLAV